MRKLSLQIFVCGLERQQRVTRSGADFLGCGGPCKLLGACLMIRHNY
jgi:hypothetical protein